jgi:hypothetical protein
MVQKLKEDLISLSSSLRKEIRLKLIDKRKPDDFKPQP